MQQQQDFKITPDGVVRGGDATYTADLVTGAVIYDIEVLLPFWQKQTKSGTYQADPKDLQSDALKNIGDYIKIGPVTFYAKSIDTGVMNVLFKIDNSNVTGSAELDITGPNFKINQLQAIGSAAGFNFNLLLTPVR